MSSLKRQSSAVVIGEVGFSAMAESVARGFVKNGWETHLLATPETAGINALATAVPESLRHRFLAPVLQPAHELRVVRDVSRLSPTIVVLVKCDRLHLQTIRSLKSVSQCVVAFHPDDPFAVQTLWKRGPSHRRAIEIARSVDRYFIWSHDLVSRLHEAGVSNVCYLPFAYDPELHPGAEPNADVAPVVAFVGNWDKERERWLAPLADFDLRIWGSDYWRRRCETPALRRAWQGRVVHGEEMAECVRRSAINLNVLRNQNKGACNMRSFEIPGAGGFLLHERSPEFSELFEPGAEMADFGSDSELRAKVSYYLQHSEERVAIARRGWKRALDYTYESWVNRMLATVGLNTHDAN
ncbi:MAG: glycosyltransferase [Myxococcota bacterium]